MKPKILVTRATFDDVIAKLRERYEVEDNQKDDAPWSAEEFGRRIADKDGVVPTGSDRVDAATLAAAPRLKAVSTSRSATTTSTSRPAPSEASSRRIRRACSTIRPRT